MNFDEAKTVTKLLKYLTNDIKSAEGFGERKPYDKSKFWILSTYHAQQIVIKSQLEELDMEDQVITIDGA